MSINNKHDVNCCELCSESGGELLWRNEFCRVVLVNDAEYPGFCRVIVNRHVKEMTDLNANERNQLMAVVFTVEQSVRDVMQPEKVNLASLGNVVPHVHWHVIPRFADDRHFPNAIWGSAKREATSRTTDIAALRKAVVAALS